MRLLSLVFALSITVTAAQAADCPTKADLANGITFRTTDGNTEVHRAGNTPGLVTLQVRFADGDGSLIALRHGIYMLSVIPMTKGKPDLTAREDYAGPEAEGWPVPKPSARWTTRGNGGATATSGAAHKITIGDCTYEGFEVALDFTDEEDYVETYTYLPALGLALLIQTKDKSGTDDIGYTHIGKLK